MSTVAFDVLEPGVLGSTASIVYKAGYCRLAWSVDGDRATLANPSACATGGSGGQYTRLESGTLELERDSAEYGESIIRWDTEGPIEEPGPIYPPEVPPDIESCRRREQFVLQFVKP